MPVVVPTNLNPRGESLFGENVSFSRSLSVLTFLQLLLLPDPFLFFTFSPHSGPNHWPAYSITRMGPQDTSTCDESNDPIPVATLFKFEITQMGNKSEGMYLIDGTRVICAYHPPHLSRSESVANLFNVYYILDRKWQLRHLFTPPTQVLPEGY